MKDKTELAYSLKEDMPQENIPSSNKKKIVLTLNRKSKNPLLEWLVIVSALGIILTLFVGSFFITAFMSDNSGITQVILGIFVLVIIKNFLDTKYLHKQISLANSQIKQLRHINNIPRFIASSENSLLRDHILNLYEIYKRDVSISQNNLITLLQARLLSRTKITDFCSSLLVTLGLIGTIIGLIISTGGLEVVIDSVGENPSGLLAGMKKTVMGIGTAFYTTLFGAVLGGIFLRFLGNLVDSNIEFLVSCIAEMTEIYILPVFRSAARAKDSRHMELLSKINHDDLAELTDTDA